jgi:hypothetical protein
MVELKFHSTSAEEGARARRRLTGVDYLAMIGVAIVCYALWTWGAWLLDGPHQIIAFRDPSSPTRWIVHLYELAIIVVAVVLTVRVVRECRRKRRFTYDAVLIVAGCFTLFWDPMVNWMQPNFMYSSQWINLNTWTGHAPWVVNPTAGLMPQPIVFIGLIYPFGILLFCMGLNAGMSAARRWRPSLSTAQLIAGTYVGAFLVCLLLEAPMFLLNLWGLPGAPAGLAFFDDNHRFAWAEYLTTSFVFTAIASLRFFKNDRGETLTERGLDGTSASRRVLTSILATITLSAMSMWVLLLVQIPAGLHSSPYPAGYPRHLINNLCNVQPDMNTAYGACPGSPGFTMPVSNSFIPKNQK